MPLPLEGIRVIDTTTGPVGGIATMVLADFGADVVKVEPPGGDRFRSLAAAPLWLRGKRSVMLDLHTSGGLERLHMLVRGADVLVVSGPPSRALRWGVDAAAAAELQPTLVHCSITGWGPVGPLAEVPGYSAAVAARAGRMKAFSGQISRPGPVFAALPVAAHIAAHGAVQGIVSALISRDRTGQPQFVATSLLQALLPFDLVELLLLQMAEISGVVPATNPGVGADMPTLNYHPVRTKDGLWIQCGNLLEHLFLSFLDAIDLYDELLADDGGRFLSSPAEWTPEATDVARNLILVRMQEKTAEEWMAIFHADGNVAAEPYATSAEALHHPDLVDNAAIVEVVDRKHGPVRMIGAIATMSETPAQIGRPAPLVGEHNEEILGARTNRPVMRSASGTVRSGRPLDGITVVEFATVIAAPLGTSMLADLGARVIRVEPIEGDSFRHLLPLGVMAVKTTAGKESICLDLKSVDGRAVARKLVERADVVVHNYRPGVPERLGIGYDELHRAFPRLVWVSVNGYGPNGPSARRPATHPVAGASMGGAGYQAGAAVIRPCNSLEDIRENARQLMRANESNPDPNTSAVIGSATLLALLVQERFGIGQSVFIDMLTANAHANADAFLSYPGMAGRPAVDDELWGTGPLHRLYPCRTGWVFLALGSEAEKARFAAESGLGALPPDNSHLTQALTELFATCTADEWEARLTPVGIACVAADEMTPGPFALRHPQMLENGFTPLTNHARFGTIRRWGPIVHVNGAADRYGPGVLAGEHTDSLLDELGYGATGIAALRASGIVASEPIDRWSSSR